jgi:DNA-binding NarL/FixJ family response regulator
MEIPAPGNLGSDTGKFLFCFNVNQVDICFNACVKSTVFQSISRCESSPRQLEVRSMALIRTVIADDHEGIRSALVSYLSSDGHGIKMVGEASNGSEAVQLCREHSPDVLLLDLRLPDLDGAEVTRQLQAEGLRVRVLVISAFFSLIEKQSIHELLKNGASGCITKDEAIELLVPAIHSIAGGENWLSPGVKRVLDGIPEENPG